MNHLFALAVPRGVKISEIPLDTWYVNAMTAKLRGEAAINPVIAETRIIDTAIARARAARVLGRIRGL